MVPTTVVLIVNIQDTYLLTNVWKNAQLVLITKKNQENVSLVTLLVLVVSMVLITVALAAQLITSYTTTLVSMFAQKDSMLMKPPKLVNHVTIHV